MPLLIARRPVFDSREQIFAYDLAVRGDADATGLHQEVHPEQLLAEVFLETGVASVAGAHRVFVATSHDLLVGGTLRILPADLVLLQIPPAVPGDSGVVSACQDLVSAGYQLAVDVDDRREVERPARPDRLQDSVGGHVSGPPRAGGAGCRRL